MTEKTNETIQLKDSERQPCEVWTRVMGYHRPVQSFNIGKKGEFEERKYFVESKCGCAKPVNPGAILTATGTPSF